LPRLHFFLKTTPLEVQPAQLAMNEALFCSSLLPWKSLSFHHYFLSSAATIENITSAVYEEFTAFQLFPFLIPNRFYDSSCALKLRPRTRAHIAHLIFCAHPNQVGLFLTSIFRFHFSSSDSKLNYHFPLS